MNINSTGGTAVGGESLYKKFKELNDKKPVVSVMNTIAASAAYMIALGTEKIYAYNGSIIGSIGVISQMPNVKEAAEKLGIDVKIIRSAEFKGRPSMFEENSEESFDVIKRMMMDFYGYFKSLVKTERNLSEQQIEEVADGRIFSSKYALEKNLIDAIGTEQDAINWIIKEHDLPEDIKVKDVKLYKPEPPFEKFINSLANTIGLDSLFSLEKNEKFQGLMLK